MFRLVKVDNWDDCIFITASFVLLYFAIFCYICPSFYIQALTLHDTGSNGSPRE